MKGRYDESPERDLLREKIIGLGERSIRKSYYPELLQQLTELERFKALLDQSLDSILLVQIPSGRVVDANISACRQFANSKEQLVSKKVSELLPDEALTKIGAYFAEEKRIGVEGVMVTTELKRSDDTSVTLEMTIRPVNFSDISYAVIVARDVTDRIKAEEERSRLEGQIRQLQKMESIGLLAGGIAHDFNNLLTPILGYTEILLAGVTEGDPRREKLRYVKEAAERARDLTRQLLAFSRKQIIELKTTALGSIIRNFQEVLRRTIRENIHIEIRLAESLSLVKADAGHIEQVLVNLCINAQDAMPDGGTLTIEARDEELDAASLACHSGYSPGTYVMMAVSDTGIGMEKAVQEHIFEPFFTTKEPGRGTGLGLSTVYGIIRQHGGLISLNSEKGKGTTFKIYLPKLLNVSEEDSPEADTLTGHIRGTETILVAEDSEMVRTITSEILQGLGYNVLATENAAECIEVAAQFEGRIDMLLTDVIMPKMNGRELFGQIEKIRPGIHVLFMSGYPSNAIGQHGVLDEKENFIQKPFSVPALSEKIRQVLDSK